MKLSEMINIGKKLEKELNAIGINSSDDLIKMGSIEAARKLDSCANQLFALEGAIQGVRWHELDKGYRDELYKAYRA